jgi:hypothetical protein
MILCHSRKFQHPIQKFYYVGAHFRFYFKNSSMCDFLLSTSVIGHDKSTYKSGEMTAKRWIMSDNAPFYNKGRGRSIMSSDLLIMHPSGPFFSLTDKEYSEALKAYPNLHDDYDINYEKNSASATINVGGENYFDNENILHQFKHLFQLLPFKKEYENHEFFCLVDNARTHTATEYSVNDFGMKPGTRYPVDNIDFIDEDGGSIGLLALAHELNVFVPRKCSLNELKQLLAQHAAFKKVSRVLVFVIPYKKLSIFFFNLFFKSQVSKLEKVAAEYNVKIVFTPKFHCETNPIEGYWCHSKQYIRKHTDQNFQRLIALMPEAKGNFIQKQIHLKHFHRFWRTIKAYDGGKYYRLVLTIFFSGLCNDNIIPHREITNANIDD